MEHISIGNCPSCSHFPAQFIAVKGDVVVRHLHLAEADKSRNLVNFDQEHECPKSEYGYLKKLEKENDALRANLANLKAAALHAVSNMTKGEAKARLCAACKETPDQSLAEIEAAVVNKAVAYAKSTGMMMGGQFEDYVAGLQPTEKEGEP